MTTQTGIVLCPGEAKDMILSGQYLPNYVTIDGDLEIEGVTIRNWVTFYEGVINGKLSFRGSTIKGPVHLGKILIMGDLNLHKATVEGEISIVETHIKGSLNLEMVRIKRSGRSGELTLLRATIEKDLNLQGANIRGNVELDETTVNGRTLFIKTKIQGCIHGGVVSIFKGPTLCGRVDFTDAIIKKGVCIPNATINNDLILDGACIKSAKYVGAMFFRETILKGMLSLVKTKIKGDITFEFKEWPTEIRVDPKMFEKVRQAAPDKPLLVHKSQ